jgi:glycosidase
MIPANSVIYQIVIDRYDNDDGTLHREISAPDYNGRFDKYLGGTFNGIRRHMNHIENLGVSHVLLSPVNESKEYHAYHPTDNLLVNHRFGSEEDLRKLIEDFHRRNIKVMLDYVSTHVSSSHELFQRKSRSQNPEDREWFLFTNEIESHPIYRPYFDELAYKMTSGHPEKIREANLHEYLSYFGLVDCPLLNLENPEVKEWHKRNLDYWIENFGFDDVRFDSGFIQPKLLASEISQYLKKHGDINLITENWDFENSEQDCFGLCDGEFDISPTLLFNRFSESSTEPEREEFFKKIIGYYHRNKHKPSVGYSPIVSLDNHDLPRFSGSKNLQKILATLQFSLLSVPLIYYGNEIGMKQYNDGSDRVAQSRDPMRFDLWDGETVDFYKNLIKFRRDFFTPETKLGEFLINDHGSLFSCAGYNGDQSFYVILNLEDRDKPVILNQLFRGEGVNAIGRELIQEIGQTDPSTFLVKGNSSYILRLKNNLSANNDISPVG